MNEWALKRFNPLIDFKNLEPNIKLNFLFESHENFLIEVVKEGVEYTIKSLNNDYLSLAIYTLLDRLGYRFPYPGKFIKVNPKPIVGSLKYSPKFDFRFFFGTHGTPRNPYLDKGQIVDKTWNQFIERNRCNKPNKIGGHSYDTFRYENYDLLIANPEWMSLIWKWGSYYVNNEGKRVRDKIYYRMPVAAAGKFCVSNPELFARLVEYFVKKSENSEYVSTEPSDGDNWCVCDKCINQIGGPSEQAFYIANEVAKKIPNKAVTMYAYNKHVSPPSFPLEKNVHVALAPGMFQKTYLTPDGKADYQGMFSAWYNFTKNPLYLRDYYGMPNNIAVDMPRDPMYPINTLNKFVSFGLKGANFESTYSLSTVNGLYAFARYSYDGGVSDHIKHGRLVFGEHIYLKLQRLWLAENKEQEARKQLIWAKTNSTENNVEYNTYLTYLIMFFNEKKGLNTKEDVVKFAWQTHWVMALHSYAITFYYGNIDSEIKRKYDWKVNVETTKEYYDQIKPLTNFEIFQKMINL